MSAYFPFADAARQVVEALDRAQMELFVSDFASFHNIDPQVAARSIEMALDGDDEALWRYGYDLRGVSGRKNRYAALRSKARNVDGDFHRALRFTQERNA